MTGIGVYIDVLDANGVIQGNPLMNALNVSVSRMLDGAGSISVSFPANDKRVTDLVINERRLKIYYWQDGKVTRNVGTMIVRRKRWSGPSGGNLIVDGPSEIAELKDINTYRNYSYGNPSGASIQSVIDGLLALATGWTSNVDATIADNLISGRFEGFSVLKALQYIASQTGYHFRQTAGSKVIEFGAFGTDTGITLIKPSNLHPEINDNDNIGIITTINVTEDSENIVNTLIPIGGGEGSAAVTLDESDKTTPYTIQDVSGQGSQTFKGLVHDASVGTYGTRAKVLAFKNIAPIANSAAAKLLAGNALYDAGVAYLERNATPQSTYSCNVFKINQALAEGDKIHLTINEMIETFSPTGKTEYFIPKNVDADFWIMDITERIDQSGSSYSMKISDIDKREESLEKTIIGSIENAELNNLVVKTFPNWVSNTYYDTVQGSTVPSGPYEKTAIFYYEPDPLVTDVPYISLRFRTKPLSSQSLVSTVLDLVGGNNNFWAVVINSTIYPKGIKLLINGVDVTEDVHTSTSGNAPPTNSAIDSGVINITDYIVNAVGGLYQRHTIEMSCEGYNGNISYPSFPANNDVLASSGVVEATISSLAITQALLPT